MPRFDRQKAHFSPVRPVFSIHGSSNATLTSNVATKPTLDTVSFTATGTAFDTTNQKYLPTVAGKYQLNASASVSSTAAITSFTVAIRKNGALVWESSSETGSADTAVVACCSKVVNFNGSTDYVELLVTVVSTGTITLVGSIQTSLDGFWIGS
jgi:hypothetical protein